MVNAAKFSSTRCLVARAVLRAMTARRAYVQFVSIRSVGFGSADGSITSAELASVVLVRFALILSHFMNKFRKSGFIDYNGHLEVHSSLLSVVLAEQPRSVEPPAVTS